jgi:hypothetical protein
MAVRAIDLSNSGIRVESSEPIDPHTDVYVRAERYGLTGSTSVRHCSHRASRYILGLEFKPEARAGDSGDPEAFVDYYELLQISPNAEHETIHRVFRIMAARYHPDNTETGDNEKFLLLSKAYSLLSDPARRASYDDLHRSRRIQPLPVFGLKEFAEGLEGELNRRLGILSLLYNRRRANPDNPGISHLEFAIWFLHEKQYLRTGNTSDYSISAAGVEYLESEIPSNAVVGKLLHAPKSAAEREPVTGNGEAPEESSPALALVRAR